MQQERSASASSKSLGADLRALRKARGLTLAQMSDRLGRSVGWVSQVERDLSHPSFEDLRAMAGALGVPLSMLFGQAEAAPEESGVIVRAQTRRRIGKDMPGLEEELLSPDLTDEFEVVHSTFKPGARLPRPVKRPTCELGYVISGRLDLTIEGRAFSIGPGDSFRIRNQAFSWSNPHEDPAVVIWVIAPPVY